MTTANKNTKNTKKVDSYFKKYYGAIKNSKFEALLMAPQNTAQWP